MPERQSRALATAALLAIGAALAVSRADAQDAYRCTSADGKVTYQGTPCPGTSEQRKVDTTPANTEFDPRAREQLLKEGAEAGKRLEARAAEEAAERRRRAEERERDEQREREAQAREEARDNPSYIYAAPPGVRPPFPTYPPSRPQYPPYRPRPSPQPATR